MFNFSFRWEEKYKYRGNGSFFALGSDNEPITILSASLICQKRPIRLIVGPERDCVLMSLAHYNAIMQIVEDSDHV